jgi:hypothetical protein
VSDERTVDLVELAIRHEYNSGFVHGTLQMPQWSFPHVCACCGSAADTAIQEVLEYEYDGQMKLTLPLNVPYCQTCAGHVATRSQQTRGNVTLSKAIGFAAAAVGALDLWGVKGGNPLEAVFPSSSDAQFMSFLATAGPGVAGWSIADRVLSRRAATQGGVLLPSTDHCTETT